MVAANLTDRTLRALKPNSDGSQRDVFDGDARGLSARCSTLGGVTWCFTYTSQVTRKRRRLKIGTYPAWSLADARACARDLRHTVEAGRDPIDDARAKARRMTVARLFERYLTVIEKTHRDHKKIRRSIERDVLPALGSQAAEDVKRRDIISILDAIAQRGAPVHANRVRSMLSAMWGWAISEDLIDIEVSPASNIKNRVEERAGTRWLTTEEIKSLAHTENTCQRLSVTRLNSSC